MRVYEMNSEQAVKVLEKRISWLIKKTNEWKKLNRPVELFVLEIKANERAVRALRAGAAA